MEKIQQKQWPEIVYGSSDPAESQAIHRALKKGLLRKIILNIYSSHLTDTAEQIVLRNQYQIIDHLFPGAVISHRSALESGVVKGIIFLTYKYTRTLKLPGLTIQLLKGEGAQEGDTSFLNHLVLASRPRALLENLQVSRASKKLKKTLTQQEIENYLDKLCQIYGDAELNKIRDAARKLADKLHLKNEFMKLDKLIGALLGTQDSKQLMSENAHARALQMPYDTVRLEIFSTLFLALNAELLPQLTQKNHHSLKNLAFFEAYFSNYIEGTEFEVDEAAKIIFENKINIQRSADSHDILSTYQMVVSLDEMEKTPANADELIALLQSRHALLMHFRPDKDPGHFKDKINRAGNTIFVKPELVRGTLKKAFNLYQQCPDGLAKALFMMFIVSEIHPFIDGNGRIARIMMNAELTHANQSRIIIPNVYRDDYLIALRLLSRSHETDAYIRMMLRAQAFTSQIDFHDYEKAKTTLIRCNAFANPDEAKLKMPSA